MKKALIVVDMLNDFIWADGALYCGPTADAIVPKVLCSVARQPQQSFRMCVAESKNIVKQVCLSSSWLTTIRKMTKSSNGFRNTAFVEPGVLR